MTALKSGDYYFDRFFGSLDKPADHGNHTYWIRQNWGTPTLTLSQEMRLPEGEYTLTADMWKSGAGGDAKISVETEGGSNISTPSIENQTAWQQVELQFQSDGKASTTIRLEAIHNSAGSEKIIGFDNVLLTKVVPDGIILSEAASSPVRYYDLQGRRTENPQKGIFIRKSDQRTEKLLIK